MRHDYGPVFNLFNDTFSELQRLSDNLPTNATFAPKFDVKETKDSYTLEGELPGIDQKDVTIEFTDEQTLIIKGRTEHRHEEGQPPQTSEAEDVQEGESAAEPSQSKEVATSGSTEVAKAGPQHTYWISERSVGSFQRSFSFPQPVSQDAKASLKNGILSLVIPKVEKQNTTRRINIE